MLLSLRSQSFRVLQVGLGPAWGAGGKSRGRGLVRLNHKLSRADFHSKPMGTQSGVMGEGRKILETCRGREVILSV